MKPLKHKHLTFLSFLLALLLIFSALPLQVMAEDPIQPEIESGGDDLIPADPSIPGDPDEPNGPVLPDDPGDSPISVTEGIYRFGTPLHNLHINTPNKVSLSGQRLIQWNNEDGVLSRFKICSLGNNTYCIRSMANNQLALTASGTNVILSNIGSANSSSVPTTARWQFFYGTWGKYVKNVSTGTVISAPFSSDYGEDRYITLSNYTGLQRHGWYTTLVSSDTAGVEIYHKVTQIAVGETFPFAAGAYSSVISNNPAPSVTWSVTNGTGSATINSTGVLTGVSTGTVTVTASFTYSGNTYSDSCTVYVVPFQSGVYCIKNKGLERYLQALTSETNGETVRTTMALDFSGDLDQKWALFYAGNGYYKIQSVSDATVLSIGATTAWTLIDHQPDIGSDTQLWRITPTSSGAYKICPKSEENASVEQCAGVMTYQMWPFPERFVIQCDYTNNSDYLDEWDIYKINYIAIVNNYYDLGYPVRYGELEEESAEKIKGYNLAVAEQYLKFFGLDLQIANTNYYQSPIDLCKAPVSNGNIDTLCSHNGTIHTDRSAVIADFSVSHSGNNTTTNILWSCHRIRSVATSGEYNFNRSCSVGTGIYLIEISDIFRDRNSKGVLMHELNHQYSARDHYHELADLNDPDSCKFKDICSVCGNNPRPSSCVMNDSRIDISSNSVICDACKGDILIHLQDHHNY